MKLTSTAFADGEPIPLQFTQDGADVSPPLAWYEAPAGTRSYALIVDDPDAPDPDAPRKQPFVHWLLWDLPPELTAIPEAMTRLPPGAHAGANDYDHASWDGPAPPVGKHRYRFHLYALDRELHFESPPDRAQLEAAMRGHVLDEARLTGTYKRARPG